MIAPISKSRMIALDYLRGFFIVVIIIDHLARWPSLLELATGQGILWVNAASGFIIISGLLIGYVRGYKNRHDRLGTITKKLLLRSALLYVWLCIASVSYTLISWHLANAGPLPWINLETGNWQELIRYTLGLEYTHTWVHFLYFYTVFLALSPLAIFLLRRRLPWILVLASFIGYWIGNVNGYSWLQWQPLFFLPVAAGYYLENIKAWWIQRTPRQKRYSALGTISITILTILASLFTIHILPLTDTFAITINGFFGKEPLTPGAIVLSFVWFLAFVLLFIRYQSGIGKYLGWLFEPLGTRSLTAYIIHGMVITLSAVLFTLTTSLLDNTLIGCLCILATWYLVRLRIVQKIIPR